MLIIYFIFLAAGTIATLAAGLKWRHWSLTGISAALGVVWASTGKTIEFNTGKVIMVTKTGQLIFLIWAIVSIGVAFTMYGIMSYVKDRQKTDQRGGYAI
jgi:hypothetical protein